MSTPAVPKKRTSGMTSVNCERAARGVWLVKVPKYLSEIWQKNDGVSIGSLITGNQVVFRSNTALHPTQASDNKKAQAQPSTSKFAAAADVKPLGKTPPSTMQIPSEHSFLIKDLDGQKMAVLSEDKSHLEEDAQMRTGKLVVEGRVMKRAECRPPATTDYMKMKLTHIHQFSQPKHTVKQMDRAEVKFKPTAVHQENLAREKAKKDTYRSVRVDRDIVLKEIFQAFEKHQYYRLADLQRLTNQPTNYIKDVLLSIANYNTVQPHKNMWELKPEYRNYGETKSAADGKTND